MYNAQQLITESWYLSGVFSFDYEVITNDQLQIGLDRLNAILAQSASSPHIAPYWEIYDFNMVANQETYIIPNLVAVQTVTFFDQNVRYPMQQATREEYFGYSRVENISTLPCVWFLQPSVGNGTLYVYYLPQQAYAAQLTGKFQLTNVALNTDMSVRFDRYFIEYIKYRMARLLCEYANVSFPMEKQNTLLMYERALPDVSPADYTIKKSSYFPSRSRGTDIYGQVNLGRGYFPL
jgi:hypothetical protein